MAPATSASSGTIRDLLTSFSPAADFLAFTAGDGRIKVWDAARGHLQTEFADPSLNSEPGDLGISASRGHLALDYRCMIWVELGAKKKKSGGSLLVLGTGSGDVLALNVAAGQWQWRASDCHPGGVTSIGYSKKCKSVYTAGVDGMVCQLDIATGNVVQRFKSSSKAVSSLCVSPDGNILAVAAGQLKTFTCSDNKKIQKFSGHAVAVKCMKFSDDGKYILSSGVGERDIAIWEIGSNNTKGVSCILPLEHPPIFVDFKLNASDGNLYVLAISEIGVCYIWCADSLNELRNKKATKITSSETSVTNVNQGPSIFAAKIQGASDPSCHVLVAYGSIVKPSFKKIEVQNGTDVILDASQDGILMPRSLSSLYNSAQSVRNQVTALDRANAEDAVLPLPKLYSTEKKRRRASDSGVDNANITISDDTGVSTRLPHRKVPLQKFDKDDSLSIENRMRELGILVDRKDELETTANALSKKMSNVSFDSKLPIKKIRQHIGSMSSEDACKLLETLSSAWTTRSVSAGEYILPWIYYLLTFHGRYIARKKSYLGLLSNLQKMTSQWCAASEDISKLRGRFQLIIAQIGSPTKGVTNMEVDDKGDHEEEEEDEDDVDEMVYGVDESSDDSAEDAE